MFHSLDATAENVLSPRVFSFVGGTLRSDWSVDLKALVKLLGGRSADMCNGANPFKVGMRDISANRYISADIVVF